MTAITTTPNNFFISKYQKDLWSLTGYSLSKCDDPLNILNEVKEEVIEEEVVNEEVVIEEEVKREVYLPKEIMSNILSYLPKQPIKPVKYGIMNSDYRTGIFGIIHKTTPKFITYSKWSLSKDERVYYFIGTDRKKIKKNVNGRYYYIEDSLGGELKIDNKLPSRERTEFRVNQSYKITDHLTEYKLKEIYRSLPMIKKDCIRWYQDELPITIGLYQER